VQIDCIKSESDPVCTPIDHSKAMQAALSIDIPDSGDTNDRRVVASVVRDIARRDR
jgi:hypothetical protein